MVDSVKHFELSGGGSSAGAGGGCVSVSSQTGVTDGRI